MDWNHFLVVGAGKSGIAACALLQREGKQVILYDGKADLDVEQLKSRVPLLEKVPVWCGNLPEEALSQIQVAVLSPGVPTDLPWIEDLRNRGIAIWGEIELAYAFGKGRVLAITGTNGKTTTTTLLGELMKAAFSQVHVVGNIGIPYTSVADETTEDGIVVAEISSFQLETIQTFAPKVSAILNITPDHLNRHHTMEAYIATKESITKYQSPEDYCVLNYEDPVLREFGETILPTPIYFSSRRSLENGYFLEEESLYFAEKGEKTRICSVKDLHILGRHNYENVLAAVAMARCMKVDWETIRQVLQGFWGVEHRIEYVTEKRGVRFYNDSKGTNPDAAIQAIWAMEWPTLLIGGGYDKASQYEEWIEAFDGKVKKLVLLGQTAEKIAATAEKMGYPKEDILFAASLTEAVELCYANAVSGDAVLLSPACASWGMFTNYEERGRMFKELAHGLTE